MDRVTHTAKHLRDVQGRELALRRTRVVRCAQLVPLSYSAPSLAVSEIYRRNVVYHVSFSLFFICMFRVVFVPQVCMPVYVCYVTPCFCSLSWIWDSPIHADTCLHDFSVHLRAPRLCVPRCGRGKRCNMFSNPAKRTHVACQPDS